MTRRRFGFASAVVESCLVVLGHWVAAFDAGGGPGSQARDVTMCTSTKIRVWAVKLAEVDMALLRECCETCYWFTRLSRAGGPVWRARVRDKPDGF